MAMGGLMIHRIRTRSTDQTQITRALHTPHPPTRPTSHPPIRNHKPQSLFLLYKNLYTISNQSQSLCTTNQKICTVYYCNICTFIALPCVYNTSITYHVYILYYIYIYVPVLGLGIYMYIYTADSS